MIRCTSRAAAASAVYRDRHTRTTTSESSLRPKKTMMCGFTAQMMLGAAAAAAAAAEPSRELKVPDWDFAPQKTGAHSQSRRTGRVCD